MTSALDRLRSRAGQSLPEYAILLTLVATGLLIILLGFRTHLQSIYAATSNALGSVASAVTGGGGGGTTSGGGGAAGGGGDGGSIAGGSGDGSNAGGGGSSAGDGGSSSGGGDGSSEPPPLIHGQN